MPSVLVIGLGPAGAASAIFLARAGLAVTAVDRRLERRRRIGESLPPDAGKVLRELGIWEAFRDGPHRPCFGNQSVWGSPELRYTDFIHHPQGHGWHLDRAAFEEMLIGEARRLGVRVVEARVRSPERCEGGWRVAWERGGGGERFDFVVDGSGRSAWFARQQGLDRLLEDQQLALVAFPRCAEPQAASASLVEAVESGWWYSASIPSGRLATAFLCSPDPEARRRWATSEGWLALAAQAPHTWARMRQVGCSAPEDPGFVPADSGVMERVCGDRWLAVGDAALTWDPIASHGIQMALVTARDGALAVQASLAGKPEAQVAYQTRLFDAFATYSRERSGFYLAERRFPHAPYWRRRTAR